MEKDIPFPQLFDIVRYSSYNEFLPFFILSLSLSLSLSSILWGLSFDNNDNLLRLLTVPIYIHW